MESEDHKIDVEDNSLDSVPWYSGKTAARLLAIQGAYTMMFTPHTVDELPELLEYLKEAREILGLGRVDKKLLARILEALITMRSEVDATIAENISKAWSMDRLNLVSLAIIQAGICEMLCCTTRDSIVTNEYADIAALVLEKSEVSFVSAILNKAKSTRAPVDYGEVLSDPHGGAGEHTVEGSVIAENCSDSNETPVYF